MLVNKPWLRFIVEPEGGEPSGAAPAPVETPPEEQKPDDKKPEDGDEKLGEPGLKALKAERAAREKAEQKIAAYEAEKEKARIAKLDGKEKAEAERDALAKERDEARAEAAVERAARKHSITDDKDLKLLAAVPADQVEAFAARLAKAPSAGRSGLPAGGAQEKAPLEQQIAEAQKARDFTRVIALKQQLAAR